MNDTINKTKLTVITASVAAQVLHECLDDVEGTAFYKQSLKQATKRMQKELTKVCDPQINQLWVVNEKAMLAMQEGIMQISKIIAEGHPVKIAAMGDFLKNNPDGLTTE